MLGKKLGVLVLAIFLTVSFTATGQALNFLPFEDQEVYKIKLKDDCRDENTKKFKLKPVKGLHMRIFVVGESDNIAPGEPGYVPATADIVFYTSTKKDNTEPRNIVGRGKMAADYPNNYRRFLDDGRIAHLICGDEEGITCTDSAGSLVDGYVIFDQGFDKKNTSLACDLQFQGYVKSGKKKKKIKGWSIGWCYTAEGTAEDELVNTITGVSKCKGKKFDAKQVLK